VGRRALQRALTTMGLVAMTMGGSGVLRGASEVPDAGPVSGNVDSEYRFYAAWYFVLGVLLLRAARQPEEEATVVRACGGGLLLAACGRLLSIRRFGSPHPFQRVLLALEVVIPVVVVPWHRSVVAASGERRRDT
jgi:hypothetical protein